MVRNETLLVLGAGASKEIGLPTGAELKKSIADYLNLEVSQWQHLERGDEFIFEGLRAHSRQGISLNALVEACQQIKAAMPQAESIDNFIEVHRDNKLIEFCGKLAIVRSILEAERKSHLYFSPRNDRLPDFNKVINTWYAKFWQILTQHCSINQIGARLSQMKFIIFNYDRCFEHFIYCSLQNYHHLSPDDAASIVNDVEIFHPFGTIGKLPWQNNGSGIGYGAEAEGRELLNLTKQIRTFSEGTNPKESDIESLRQKLLETKIFIFLGFAFHPLNMKLLKPVDRKTDHLEPASYYATAYRASFNNIRSIERDIGLLLNNGSKSLHVGDLTCAKLFEDYSRDLALSFSSE